MKEKTNSITQWLSTFTAACAEGDGSTVASLFTDDGLWRDYLAFDLTLQTIEGRKDIEAFTAAHAASACFTNISVEDATAGDEVAFTFETRLGNGRGYLRFTDGKCSTLLTSMLDFSNLETRVAAAEVTTSDPFVLVVGGGQSGLALGAQLAHLNVPYLVIDKYPTVGDQWRSRYDSLVLHDPVWFDHLPFIPFPDGWPVFTPKDQMGDWLESYAETLNLNVQTNTSLVSARFDNDTCTWQVRVQRDGVETDLTATHLVMALGLSGFPHKPDIKGQQVFAGPQLHSSEFKASTAMRGKRVVVVGANNSAHDIASDLVSVGAKPVMLQRSSTLVVKQSVYCEKMLGKLYSPEAIAQGFSVDEADFRFTSVPMRLLEARHRDLWQEIQAEDADFYQQLTDAGFNLDFAEDGAGLGLKYRRTASGYYIDVGASRMVIDGHISIRSGVNIDQLTETAVLLDNGESIPADVVVYATGYGNMVDWVAKLIDQDTAQRVGPCWGYGSDTKGDPGPWLGELRNMWKPTAQPGLWFMGGNLAQVRYFSRVLALQLQAKYAERAD